MNNDFEKVHRHVRPYHNNSNFTCSDLWQNKRELNRMNK